MQGKKQKPKVRLTRNDDGSIGAPREVSNNTDDLEQLWGNQTTASRLPQQSVKEELHTIKSAFTKHTKKSISNKKKTLQSKVKKDAASNTVTLSMPTFKSPSELLHRKKKAILLSTAVVVVGISIFGVSNFMGNKNNNTTPDNQGEVQGAIQTKVTPEFATLSPLGKGVDDIGGFAKISPEGAPPVYAFVDTIGETPIKISQQKIPDSFRADQANKIKELATGFNAKEPLGIGDNTAYIGTSVNGAQSIVYVKGENLVLIASDTIIPNSEWVTYIGNLRY